VQNPEHSWSVRVGSTPTDAARVLVRKHTVEVGAPLSFDVDYPSVTALEHLLAALGADLVNGLRAQAKRKRIEVDRVEATVDGWLNNPLAFLGVVGETGHPGLKRVSIRLYVSTFHARSEVEELLAQVRQRSPLLHTLSPTVAIEIQLKTVL